MADIFLIYTEHDRDTVRRLAETLQAVGWSVWWDRRIPARQTWRSVLEREVQAADLVAWDGARDFPGLQQLIGDIEGMIGKPGTAQPSQPAMNSDAATAGDRLIASSRFQRVPLDAPVDRAPLPPSASRTLLPWAAAAGALLIAGGAYWITARREPLTIPEPPSAKIEAPSAIEPPSITAQPVVPPIETKPKPVTGVTAVTGATKAIDTPQRPGPKPVVRPATPVNPRCAALTERLALGETLSSESQSFFNQECRK